jgi:hypothetical protein
MYFVFLVNSIEHQIRPRHSVIIAFYEFSTFQLISPMMLLHLRHYFLIFLGLLQFATPLLHAHSGNNYSQFGLHLPTLEMYSASASNQLVLESSQLLFAPDNHLVSVVSQGVKHPEQANDPSSSGYFLLRLAIFNVILNSYQLNFSPHLTAIIHIILAVLPPTRAPPF